MNFVWIEIGDGKCVPFEHAQYAQIHSKWVKSEKGTNNWKFVVSTKTFQEYGLTQID
jgi:hypothetical protein